MEIQELPCFIGQSLGEIATDDENILGCESGDWVLPIYERKKTEFENLMLLSL